MIKGIVVNDNDPDKRGRVTVLCEAFYDPATNAIQESVWCEGKGSTAGGTGLLAVPPVGSEVWVEPVLGAEGGIERLLYSPAPFTSSTPAPPTARGEEDTSTSEMRLSAKLRIPAAQNRIGLKGQSTTVQESIEIAGLPDSANAGVYPCVQTFKTVAGLLVELDDTPGASRVTVWHPSGATFEIGQSGNIVVRGTKLWFEGMDGEVKSVGGDSQSSIAGNVQTYVGTHCVTEVAGHHSTMAGEVSLASKTYCAIDAKNAIQINAGGTLALRSGAGMNEAIVGDKATTAAGSISQTATGNVNSIALNNITQTASGVIQSTAPAVNIISPLITLSPVGVGAPTFNATLATAAIETWLGVIAAQVPNMTAANTTLMEALELSKTINVRVL